MPFHRKCGLVGMLGIFVVFGFSACEREYWPERNKVTNAVDNRRIPQAAAGSGFVRRLPELHGDLLAMGSQHVFIHQAWLRASR